jgi:hypothetical protein
MISRGLLHPRFTYTGDSIPCRHRGSRGPDAFRVTCKGLKALKRDEGLREIDFAKAISFSLSLSLSFSLS